MMFAPPFIRWRWLLLSSKNCRCPSTAWSGFTPRCRSVEETAAALGPDERAYRKLFGPLVAGSENLFRDLVGPFRFPRHPILAARFGWRGLRSGAGLASRFRTAPARALIGGVAAHGQIPLD